QLERRRRSFFGARRAPSGGRGRTLVRAAPPRANFPTGSGKDGIVGKLNGKVAIVAGSSRGIGKAIAKGFSREGARVAVVARTTATGRIPGTINQTAEEIGAEGGVALPVRCDITQEADVEAMVRQVQKELGPVDILCNSAAVNPSMPLVEVTFKRWELIFRVNVHGAFLLSRAVIPEMTQRRSGNIIHLTSGAAKFDPRERV